MRFEIHVGDVNVPYEFDFTKRHEIATGGETLTGTPAVTVLDSTGAASANIAVGGIALDGTSKKVQFPLTVVSGPTAAQVGDRYTVTCLAGLSSGGELLKEWFELRVVGPRVAL